MCLSAMVPRNWRCCKLSYAFLHPLSIYVQFNKPSCIHICVMSLLSYSQIEIESGRSSLQSKTTQDCFHRSADGTALPVQGFSATYLAVPHHHHHQVLWNASPVGCKILQNSPGCTVRGWNQRWKSTEITHFLNTWKCLVLPQKWVWIQDRVLWHVISDTRVCWEGNSYMHFNLFSNT